MSEALNFYIRTLSPVHIGCDEVYEPMGFIVDEERSELIAFEPLDFFRSLSPIKRNKLVETSKKGTAESLFELYKFMRGERFSGHHVGLCKGFVRHYAQALSISAGDKRKVQKELNKLTIYRTAFNPNTNQPYLPGSGIKGAIRTAYLNYLTTIINAPRQYGKEDARQLERALLDGGAFETDPFRMLKVSDFLPVGDAKTKIVYAVNEKKKPSTYAARGPYQMLEIVEPGSLFRGSVTIEEPDEKARIKRPLTTKKLFNSLNQFYEKERIREENELAFLNIPPMAVDTRQGYLLRVGRHSGAESVTIDGHRDIKIMKGNGEKPTFSKNGATTSWLASDDARPQSRERLKPFGWVLLAELTEAIEKQFSHIETTMEERRRHHEAVSPQNLPEKLSHHEKLPLPTPDEPTSFVELRESAVLTWNPGNRTITATWKEGKTTTKDIGLLPESVHERLINRRKSVPVRIVVRVDGNLKKIVRIEEVV